MHLVFEMLGSDAPVVLVLVSVGIVSTTAVGNLPAQDPQLTPSRSIRIVGTVVQQGTGQPVARAAILLNGRTLAITDEAGAFLVDSADVYSEYNQLEIRALGYEIARRTFGVRDAETELAITVRLERSATALPTVVVEDERVSPHMRGFEARRRAEAGHFVTAREIDAMNPASTTAILRRIPTVDVLGEAATGTLIRIHAAGNLCNAVEGYRPAIFIDGVLAPNVDIDAVLQPERIAGIEVYRGAARVPPEFNVSSSASRMAAQCGVLALWTKGPEPGDVASPFELGLRYGTALSDGAFGNGRVGVHLVTPFVTPFEFYPALNVYINAPAPGEGLRHSGWQAQLALRAWPLQTRIPWTLGAGLMLAKRTVSTEGVLVDTALSPTDVDAHSTVLTCFCMTFGPASSFVELHVLDLFWNPELQLFFGLGVRFYSRRRERS